MFDKELDDFLKHLLRQERKTELGQLIEGYRLCARAEGKSRNYICLVASSVEFLKQYLEAKGLATDVRKIDVQAIRGFILHLQSATRFALHPFARPQASGLSGYTVNTYMRSIRAFWSWLAVEGIIEENRCLKVWGKGSKERIVPFGRTTQKALWRYVTFYRPESCLLRQDMLFLTADGRPLTKNRVETILKIYGKRTGIKGVRISPHTFRHTGAVAFLRNGGDLFTLQRIMGHSSLEVLRGYVNLSQSDLRRVHESASPLDNLGISITWGQRIRK